MKITIEYDVPSDTWVVHFVDGNTVGRRRYGTIKTLIGALEDHAKEIRDEARKGSE